MTEPAAGIRREDRGPGVAGLVLDDPDRLNPMSSALMVQMRSLVAECVADDSVRVIVIRGAGRAFSTGADTSPQHMVDGNATNVERTRSLDLVWSTYFSMWEAPKPVVAQVHGYCLGMAAIMCNFVDLVVVAEDAVIGWPGLPMGGGAEGPSWATHVGIRKAKEYDFQPGTRISGTEAAAVGWANRAVPLDALHGDVQAMAERIALMPAGLLRIKKEALNRLQDRNGFRDSMQLSVMWNAVSHSDPDTAEVLQFVREVGLKNAIAHYSGRAKD
jgi:enoyl-CoA hydratase